MWLESEDNPIELDLDQALAAAARDHNWDAKLLLERKTAER